jgi:hypothetical protein
VRLPFIISILFTHLAFGQIENCNRIFCDTFYFEQSAYSDSLIYFDLSYKTNHKVHSDDSTLKLAYYVALSHYPELSKSKIELRLKSISSTMQAQPKWFFVFRSKKNRNYVININTNEGYTGITYKDLSFNSLVGWLGHEMAHIADYSKKNNAELVNFIASYVFDKNALKRTEHTADRETIKHGLGAQLLEGVNFFHRNRKVKHSYREKNKKYYLTPEEIVADMNLRCSEK